MAHINVKPRERTRVYETGRQAIQHLFLFGCYSKAWDFGGAPFGRTIEARRKIDAAVKARDFAAFKASKRRGYWRIEINGESE